MKKIHKLSVIVPVYNEIDTVGEILKRVLAVKFPLPVEIIVVDDSSSDGSLLAIQKVKKKYPQIKVFHHAINQGKGKALRTGMSAATGDFVVIQDADLEYDPQDILRLISALEDSDSEVIYGSRLTQPPTLFGKARTPLLIHYFGNKFLSLMTSLLYSVWITDMETCYKLFPKKALNDFKLVSKGFEFEPEITAKLLKHGYSIKEIPISTRPRDYSQGKKINAITDGYRAIKTLLKYRIAD